ncbi:MAG: ATP-binding protein [bacterium]|nr:ATP-binding protein [bacterium]
MEKSEIHLLVIEDNPADIRIVRELLRHCVNPYFKITHADNLAGGILKLEKEVFDTVLLDINLPDSRSLEGLTEIVKLMPDIPVIILTGADDENLAIESLQCKAADYLVKGKINTDALKRCIKYAIERKHIEEVLAKQQEELQIILDSVPSWIFYKDKENRLLRVNKAFSKMMGMSKKALEGKSLFEIYTREQAEAYWKEDLEVIRSGKPKMDITETAIINNKTRFIQTDKIPYRDSQGNIIGVISFSVDITERKQAEEILKRDKETFERMVKERSQELMITRIELDKAKRLSDIGTLAATVAHELRNPLNTILMAVYNLKRKILDPSAERSLNNIENKIVESEQIINNLLFYSKIRMPNYENFNFYEILIECIKDSKKISKKKVLLKKELEPIKNIFIESDPFQIKEVFINLLNNAHDAVSEPDGLIEIKAYDNDNLLKVCIKDNGVGISKDNLGKVFEPFFSTKSKGTGLGLSVCFQIISLHSGTINIESETGRGTEVSVNLPKKKKQ